MTTTVACAIRGCLKLATTDSRELIGQGRFVLCHDCQTSIVLDVQLSIEQNENMPAGTTRAYAAIYNSWVRSLKGKSIGHRSGMVTSVKDLEAGKIIVGGN
jgi:hypothetical protein